MAKEHFFRTLIFSAVLALALMMGSTPVAQAGVTIDGGGDRNLDIGAGIRGSFTSTQNGSANGKNYSDEFNVPSTRLYLNGQVYKGVKFEINTERDTSGGTDRVRILDAVGKFEIHDLFNIWAGRFLPPSDRSNLSGPYYLNAFDFPLVQNYPAAFAGRDDGAAVWGQVDGGRFKYQLGTFNGRRGTAATTSNQSNSPLLTGRLTYNFLDPEPGYYNSSTYYGKKDILAIGIVGMSQKDGAGTNLNRSNFTGWNVDALYEKKIEGGGAATLEGAYYKYNLSNPTPVVDPGGLVQGKSYFVLTSFLIPRVVGIGRFQPYVRYQNFDRMFTADTKQVDAGLNYIIDGFNARLTVVYDNQNQGVVGMTSINEFKAGFQLQF